MQYKTMVLELLQQLPDLHDQLRHERRLLTALDLYARQVKSRHNVWKTQLNRTKPSSNQSQIASEALEIALKELEGALQVACPLEDSEQPSAEGAMAFIRGRMRLA